MSGERCKPKTWYSDWGKRFLDLICASVMLIAFAPLFGILAILVWLKLGRPIIFKQLRPGFRGSIFEFFKFRSMTNQKDAKGQLLPDDLRLTEFGKWLRRTSLDELPQLWSVLRGDMSLVGPRPLLMEYLPLYDANQARRHEVRPGITGYAQVNGRNAISWDEKFRCDSFYVDNYDLYLDCRILLLTVVNVLRRSNISNAEHPTMPLFRPGSSGNERNNNN